VTHEPARKTRPKGDEGQAYTRAVMREVKRLRVTRGWTAEQLASEMDKVAVPWTRDTVVNLETGRRKRLAAHEVLALAYVLEVDNPVDLLVPRDKDPLFVVVPNQLVDREAVRAWFEGRTGPLREWLKPTPAEDAQAQEMIAKLIEAGTDPELAEQMLKHAISFAARKLSEDGRRSS